MARRSVVQAEGTSSPSVRRSLAHTRRPPINSAQLIHSHAASGEWRPCKPSVRECCFERMPELGAADVRHCARNTVHVIVEKELRVKNNSG